MLITERGTGDRERLQTLSRKEKNAEQRDRFRAVLLAIDGHETREIQVALDRSRGFVQRWAYAYRKHGIEAIRAKPQGGKKPRLPSEQEAKLKERLNAGPIESDGVCTLRGKDVQRILEKEFGQSYSLNGVYDLLHRLGFSCLKPRPRHEKNDPQKMKEFKERAPFLFRA